MQPPRAALLHLHSSLPPSLSLSLFAFDLPLALKPLSVPPRYSLSPGFYTCLIGLFHIPSPPRTSTRPSDKTDPYLKYYLLRSFTPLPFPRYPNLIKATTGSVAYTWEDNRPLRSYDPLRARSFVHKDRFPSHKSKDYHPCINTEHTPEPASSKAASRNRRCRQAQQRIRWPST